VTVTVRRLVLSATFGAGPTTIPNVLQARASFGFDKRVSECAFVTPIKPACTYDDLVTVTMGAGNNIVRFVGLVRDFQYSDTPRAVTTVCKGRLVRAVEYENGDVGTAGPPNGGEIGLAINDLVGTQLATASQIVQAVLTRANVPFTAANIQSTSIQYGAIYEAFIWAAGVNSNPIAAQLDPQGAGETALEYIERYDAIDGTVSGLTGGRYRTFETIAGDVWRFLVGGRPRNAVDFTLTEGIDILDGNIQRSISDTRNYFVVSGYDYGVGTGPFRFALQESNPFQPSSSKHTYSFGSPMIERDTNASTFPFGATGQTCEMLCNVFGMEYNREIVTGWVTTFRDDAFGVAQTHLVQGNVGGGVGNLGVGENLWVQSLDISVDSQGFTQRLGYIGGGIPAGNTGWPLPDPPG